MTVGKTRLVIILSSRLGLFLPGLVLAILGTAFGMYWLVNVDVALILEWSARLLDGEKLYQDVIDTQFPAIYLISLFVVWFSCVLHISAINGFFLFVFLLLNGCIGVSWHIFKQNGLAPFSNLIKTSRVDKASTASGPPIPSQHALILFALYFALFALPFAESNWHLSFGEREHLFCALILPYIAIVLNRLQSVQTNQKLTVIAGVLAGIGFSIKPHFLVLLATSEFFMIYRTKNPLFWLRTESAIILAMLLLYYLGMIFFTPQYFQLIPYFVDFYKGIAIPRLGMFYLCLLFSLIPLLLFAWFLAEKKMRPTWYFVPYLLILSLASLVIHALGVGNFYYHLFPFKFITFLLVALMLCTHSDKKFSLVFLSLLGALILLYGVQQFLVVQEKRHWVFALAQEMRHYAPHGPVVAFDSNLAPTFPAINYAQARWGLSVPWLLYIPFAYKEYREKTVPPPYHAPDQMGKTERFFHEKVMRDLEAHPPQLVVVAVGLGQEWLGNMPFDFIAYFSKDTRFVKFWKNYRWVSHVSSPTDSSGFDFYQRITILHGKMQEVSTQRK